MQIGRAILRYILFDPFLERGTARQPAGHDVYAAHLRFHDGNVRLAGNWNEVVRRIAFYRSGRTEMKRHGNLMHRFSVKMHRPDTTANERPRFDRSAQTHDRNVIAVVDL